MKRLILTICLCVLFVTSTAWGDWDEGDPYKMHFPQLPDLDGWDVEFSGSVPQLADDWECSEDGWVDDVHIWYSWKGDFDGTIDMIQLGIWSNDPEGPEGGPGYSTPKELVWPANDRYLTLYPDELVTTLPWKTGGKQGWYDPVSDYNKPNDHYEIYQLNIVDIAELIDIDPYEPFYQEEGEIYWLSVCFWMVGGDPNSPGWKTSEDHFMDDAVWWDGDSGNWKELRDPLTGESLDLAFVITPEPATLSLLGLGSLVLLRKRRA